MREFRDQLIAIMCAAIVSREDVLDPNQVQFPKEYESHREVMESAKEWADLIIEGLDEGRTQTE